MQRTRWRRVAVCGAVAVLLLTMGQADAEYALEQVHPLAPGPRSLTVVGTQLFYAADDGEHGTEVWTSDGTTVGTHLVLDIIPGDRGANFMKPFAGENLFYFVADINDDALDTRQLWRSDGTSEGTFPLTLLPDHPNSPDCNPMAMLGGELLFACSDVENGTWRELWKTDGTVEGTGMIADVRPGSAGHMPKDPVLYKGEMYYAGQGDLGPQLYKTDGTAEGTLRVSEGFPPLTDWLQPDSLTVVGDKLFFAAMPNAAWPGTELFCTDGTAAGVYMVKDIRPGQPYEHSFPGRAMAAVGNMLFCTPNDGVHGVELWVSDGTEAGTRLVKDVAPGEDWSMDTSPDIAEFQGRCIAILDDGTSGDQLWVSDGTEAGTVSLAGLYDPGDGRERTIKKRFGELGDLLLLHVTCVWYEGDLKQTCEEAWLGDLDGMQRIWTGGSAWSVPAARVDDTIYLGLADFLDGTEGGLYSLVVPEPGTLAILAVGGAALLRRRRSR